MFSDIKLCMLNVSISKRVFLYFINYFNQGPHGNQSPIRERDGTPKGLLEETLTKGLLTGVCAGLRELGKMRKH